MFKLMDKKIILHSKSLLIWTYAYNSTSLCTKYNNEALIVCKKKTVMLPAAIVRDKKSFNTCKCMSEFVL